MQVHTLKAPGETRADVALNGAFEGEDVPLFTFELKRKGHFVERLLNPNTAIVSLERGCHAVWIGLGVLQGRLLGGRFTSCVGRLDDA